MNLREKLNAADHANREHMRGRLMVQACTGPCDQGRKLCPSPEACQLEDDGSELGFGLALCAVSAVAVLAALAVVFA